MTLADWYKLNHSLKENFNWDLKYLESLIPYERDLYVDLTIESEKQKSLK